MMKADVKQLWIEKLESGEYRQSHGGWGGRNDLGYPTSYCCLQVLRQEVLGLTNPGNWIEDVREAGLTDEQIRACVRMNDTLGGPTFPEIAQWVRENVQVA